MEHATKKQSVPEIITAQIIAALERGVVPWSVTTKKPYNGKSLREYTGLNRFLLAEAVERYDDLRFLTLNEVNSFGGSVIEGESGHIVFFSCAGEVTKQYDTLLQQCLNCKHCSNRQCQLSDDKLQWQTEQALLKDDAELCDDFEAKIVYVSRYYNVWNIQQTTLKDDERFSECKDVSLCAVANTDEMLEALIGTGLRTSLTDSGTGYYQDTDTIRVHSKGSFASDSEFFRHLFWLMSSACGHKSRLNLPYLSEIEDIYSYGSIVCEMAASMLCGETGIALAQRQVNDNADYVAGLIRVLREDSRFIIMAGNSAKRVVNYLLELSGTKTEVAA